MSDNERFRPQNSPNYFRDRRRRTDWVSHMATILSVLSWIFAFVVLILLDSAKPESDNIFTRWLGTDIRNYWDTSLLPIAFALLVASLCICIAAFIFNMLRMRRKTDKYKKSIIIIGIISIIGIVFFLIRFWEHLI